METAMEIIKETGMTQAELESPVLRQELRVQGFIPICPDNTSATTITTLLSAVGKYTAHLPVETTDAINACLIGTLCNDREDFVAEIAEVLDEVCPQGYYFGSMDNFEEVDWLGFCQDYAKMEITPVG